MSEKVEFKFSIDDKVKTSLGDTGIVESMAFDEGGVRYFVGTAQNSRWLKEKELQLDD